MRRLEDYLPTDSRPFSGERIINPPIKVKLKNLADNHFSERSILGSSKEEWLKKMKEAGISPDKTYEVIKVEGFGDVADITIAENDFGETDEWMEQIFEDIVE